MQSAQIEHLWVEQNFTLCATSVGWKPYNSVGEISLCLRTDQVQCYNILQNFIAWFCRVIKPTQIMYLSKFQLFNYKSFLNSELLEFKPGINIIVGQNNSGKTALLEALSLNFSHSPHQSIKTLPAPDSRIESESSVEFSFYYEKAEISAIIDKFPPHHLGILPPDDNPHTLNQLVNLFQEWIDNPADVELTISRDGNIRITGLPSNLDLYKQLEESSSTVRFRKSSRIISLERGKDGRFHLDKNIVLDNDVESFPVILCQEFRRRIYRFYAERLNVGSCLSGSSSILKPNASNLPEVLSLLQLPGKKSVYERFNQYVSTIFPQIKLVSVRPQPKQKGEIYVRDSSRLEILVWSKEAVENDREDLAFPLSECGTGIGQVLAILYVVITSLEPRIIIIDEPQSFLHPGAAKKLVEILKEFPQHQYFIATHSPQIISAANPSTIVQLRYEDGETKASVIDSRITTQLRFLLAEVGVSLSDVFGADNILWVEGPTEERCFPLILEKVAKQSLRGTQIVAVQNTGDLEGKRARLIFDIYDKLSGGNSLFPPAIGFIFDREERSEQEIKDLQKRSSNLVEFLPRRMYENYLLHPEAIAAVINGEDKCREQPQSSTEVREWLNKTKKSGLYLSKGIQKESLSDSQWFCLVDGANLLKNLFSELSETRIEFSKTKHSFEMTKWLVENTPAQLEELADFLQNVLNRKPKVESF